MISVITPAYNAENFIEETIKSVLDQTYTDWEMIIVDDHSSDKTVEKAKAYADKDKRIKVIINEANKGVAETRNAALWAAKGEYIAFLDSDDLWAKDKLEKQYLFMEKNAYALTYTKYRVFNKNINDGKEISVPKQMTYTDIFKNTAIACLTVMVNRRMTGDFYMPNLNHTEDQCTWQDILSRGYTAYALDEVLAYYREGNQSLTANKRKVIKRQWHTYRRYHKLPLIKSAYYFLCYAYNAFKKHYR